jgi:hypothetical protein
MKITLLTISLLISSFVFADDKIPVWEYPILGSEHIGNNCSEEANKIFMQISFSSDGEVKSINFLKKSTISAINQEAKRYMMEESPFMEFEDMSEEEKRKYNTVNMSYIVPCSDS